MLLNAQHHFIGGERMNPASAPSAHCGFDLTIGKIMICSFTLQDTLVQKPHASQTKYYSVGTQPA
eukprot:890344-Pelagomonas_calceolata.AAC.1